MTHFHAPEPWHLSPSGTIRDAQNFKVIDHAYHIDVNRTTAERIVSCINACAGIETIDLKEIISLGKAAHSAISQMNYVIEKGKKIEN